MTVKAGPVNRPPASSSNVMVALAAREAQAMPTYVYRCEQCGDTFERVESISAHGANKPPCPKCGSDHVASVPARFVAITGKKS